MKVYIGPYPPFWNCRVHERYMYRKYGSKSYVMPKKDRTWDDRLVAKFEDAVQWVYNQTINRYGAWKKRTIRVKVHGYDTWSADHTLALIISPVLKKLKENKHGGPKIDDEDVPENLRSSQDPDYNAEVAKTGGTDKFWFDRWDWVLDEMIYAFEMTIDDSWEQEFYSGEIDIKFVPIDANDTEVPEDEAVFYRMDRGPNDTSKVDREGIKQIQDRIDNGYRLFGKYYRALWT